MSVLLGCIADDFTGATDLANTLVRGGMRTTQVLGVPNDARANLAQENDALVVALKSRTTPPGDAVRESLTALKWLQAQGCEQFFFKYCSTFDSTADGNIGPVADALLDALNENFSIACPAFPENARTVFNGYLFVGSVLLNESGMQNHPLTPMTDASLVRVLAAQTPHNVGLVDHKSVSQGARAITCAFDQLKHQGVRHAIVDATQDADLMAIGAACANLKLLTGGSGVALGLPENFRASGKLGDGIKADSLPNVQGKSAVIAGSCSLATQRQVEVMAQQRPAYYVDPLRVANGDAIVDEAMDLARAHLDEGPVLVYSTSPADTIKAVQDQLGRARAGEMIESTLADIALALRDEGVARLVVAGGETSGAVVSRLGVGALRIGPQIDPGVPWTLADTSPPIALALKSGNFGDENFFLKSLAMLDVAA